MQGRIETNKEDKGQYSRISKAGFNGPEEGQSGGEITLDGS